MSYVIVLDEPGRPLAFPYRGEDGVWKGYTEDLGIAEWFGSVDAALMYVESDDESVVTIEEASELVTQRNAELAAASKPKKTPRVYDSWVAVDKDGGYLTDDGSTAANGRFPVLCTEPSNLHITWYMYYQCAGFRRVRVTIEEVEE